MLMNAPICVVDEGLNLIFEVRAPVEGTGALW